MKSLPFGVGVCRAELSTFSLFHHGPFGSFCCCLLGCFAGVWSVSAGFCGQCSWWDITCTSSHGMLGSSPGKGLSKDMLVMRILCLSCATHLFIFCFGCFDLAFVPFFLCHHWCGSCLPSLPVLLPSPSEHQQRAPLESGSQHFGCYKKGIWDLFSELEFGWNKCGDGEGPPWSSR